MEKTKVTKKERYAEMKGIFAEMGRQDLVEFCSHEEDLLNRKSNKSGSSKTQKENVEVKAMLVDELKALGRPVTVTELMKESQVVANYQLENGLPLSNQKVSSLLNQMVKSEDKEVTRTPEGRKTYFSA